MIDNTRVKNIGPDLKGHKGLKRRSGMSPYLPGEPMNKLKFPNDGINVLKGKSKGTT